MNFKIFIISIFLLTQLTDAQWDKVEEIISPLIFSALFSGDNIYIGTDTLYISSDKGLTWRPELVAGEPVDITALFRVNGRIFAGTYGKGIYQSTDDGESWHIFNSGLNSFALFAKTFVLSGDTLFYGSDGGGVYFLKLNSSEWQSYNQNLPSNYAWTIIDLAVTNSTIIASSGGSGYHYLRPKGSAEWMERTILTPGGSMTTPNVLLSMGDTVFAGSRYGIFRSIDSGYNWDSVGIRALPLTDVVSFVKDRNRIYAGFTRSAGNDFFIWYSDDFGDTWNFMDHQFQYLNKIYIFDNKIWASTNDGLWFNKLEPVSAGPIEIPLTYKLEQNYPNPFNPSTKISWQSTVSSWQTLKIYDVLGNEIVTLVNEEKPAGTYQVEFDGSKLTSGVYFYRLQAGTHREVKKMMLVK
jgi:photosystem II stability/assembly factor-like uncharacterized protein